MEIFSLHRVSTTSEGTFGVLIDYDRMPVCVTLEDEWLDNAVGISCIPAGNYICTPYSSARFPDVWEVQNVVDRAAILWHAGNTNNDTQGCILPGEKFGVLGGNNAVLNSRVALDALRNYIGTDNAFVLGIYNSW